MRLLKKVDVQFTKKNVYDVLESYRSYVRMAGAEYLPKITTTYSFEPKTFTGKNTATENMVIEHVDAEAEVLEIERAVNCIMDPYRSTGNCKEVHGYENPIIRQGYLYGFRLF